MKTAGNTMFAFVVTSLAVGLFVFTVPTASASPMYYAGTDHYYELVEQSGLTWAEADAAAQAKSYPGSNKR